MSFPLNYVSMDFAWSSPQKLLKLNPMLGTMQS